MPSARAGVTAEMGEAMAVIKGQIPQSVRAKREGPCSNDRNVKVRRPPLLFARSSTRARRARICSFAASLGVSDSSQLNQSLKGFPTCGFRLRFSDLPIRELMIVSTTVRSGFSCSPLPQKT